MEAPPVHLRRPSPAFIVASLALAISLGGTAWAAVRITSSAQLANGVVSAPKLATGSVGGRALAAGAVKSIDVAPRAITGDRLADGTVTSRQLANGAVDARKLRNPIYYAVVANCQLVRGTAVSVVTPCTPSSRTIVRFGVDVSMCGLLASVSGIGTTPPYPGVAIPYRSSVRGDQVIVDTKDALGVAAGRSFTLLVIC